MKRRNFLKTAAITPVLVQPVTAQETNRWKGVSSSFFEALPSSKADRNKTIVECANELCTARKTVSEPTLTAVINTGQSAEVMVRRVHFGVRILNEYNITDKIDESMIETGRRNLSDLTRYLPLVGSFNNLCTAACAVESPDPDPVAVKDFLTAALAFGIEVSLWAFGTPYKMAWQGTRFIANRTFLRLTRYGCHGCIALAMSELHWAIRASVYGDVVTEQNIEFVSNQLRELATFAKKIDYEVQLDYSPAELKEILGNRETQGGGGIFPQEKQGILERYIPDFELTELDFDLNWP